MSITAITLASCGKAEETTAKANNAIPATEAVFQETEEPETETMTAEDYVKFEEIEKTAKYAKDMCSKYENPNMTQGEIVVGGACEINEKVKVDA